MFKKSAFSVLLIIGVIFLSACANSGDLAQNKVKTYKIGVLAPLSGEYAQYGQEQQKILDYRLAELNKKNNFQVELVYEDGACEVGAAAESMKRLVEDQKIQLVIGGLCSAATFAAAPIAKENKVILLSATTSNPELEGYGPHILSLSYPVTLTAEATIEELAKYKKIATLSEKSLDTDLMEKFLDDLLYSKYPDLKIVADEKVERDTENLDEAIVKIKDSGAEVLWLNPTSVQTAMAMLKAVEKAGLKIQLLGQFVYNHPDVLAMAPAAVNGMIIIDVPTIKNGGFHTYFKDMLDEIGPLEKFSDYHIAATIDALDLLSKLVSENNGDFESIEKALATGSFSGHVGKIYFGGKSFVQGKKATKITVKDNQAIYE